MTIGCVVATCGTLLAWPQRTDPHLCEELKMLQRVAPDGFSVHDEFIEPPFQGGCSFTAPAGSPVVMSCVFEKDVPEKEARRAAKRLQRHLRRCIGAEIVDDRSIFERMRRVEGSITLVKDGVEHRIQVVPGVLSAMVLYDVTQEYAEYERLEWREKIDALRERIQRDEWCATLAERSRAIGDCGYGDGGFSCTLAETREPKLLASVFDDVRAACERCGFRPSPIGENEAKKYRVRIVSFTDSRGEQAFELIETIEADEATAHTLSIVVFPEES